MKKIFLFLFSFACVLALAVFLSPVLFQILPFKFERIFNRIVMVGVLICVVIFVRIRKETFLRYGLAWKSDSLQLLLIAFLTPIAVLSVYVAIQAYFGEAVFSIRDISVGKWISRIVTAALTGLLIGFIEEFFFRGFVFQSLKDMFKQRLILALIVTNIFYSILHFINSKRPFIDSTPDFHDSLKLLAVPFMSFSNFDVFWPGFVGLFIFGLMLNGIYMRTQSLYPAIGLHAGAVFFIKTDGLIVDFGTHQLLWGSGKMYDGIIGWAALGILYGVLFLLVGRKPSR